jgi:hypothetical protein
LPGAFVPVYANTLNLAFSRSSNLLSVMFRKLIYKNELKRLEERENARLRVFA